MCEFRYSRERKEKEEDGAAAVGQLKNRISIRRQLDSSCLNTVDLRYRRW